MTPPNQLPQRKNMRLKSYDYSRPGVYFVTICAKDHRQLFGTIHDGEVRLTDSGKIICDAWEEMPGHYPYIVLDDFVVMPNHLHGLLVINGDPDVLIKVRGPIRSLIQIVSSFKTLSAKRINIHRNRAGHTLWQHNYWDHIVRNDKELNRIREYILCNPSHWEADRLNPAAKIHMNKNITNRQDVEWMVLKKLSGCIVTCSGRRAVLLRSGRRCLPGFEPRSAATKPKCASLPPTHDFAAVTKLFSRKSNATYEKPGRP